MQLSAALICGPMLLASNQPMKLDYLWAGLCIMGAAYFIFRA